MMEEQGVALIQKVAALEESLKSAHRRIDDNDALTARIHELSTHVQTLAAQIKVQNEQMKEQNERMAKIIDTLEARLKLQGERIGEIEKAALIIPRNGEVIKDHESRLDAIEKAPADKWNKFTWLIITGVASAVVAFLIGKLL